MNPIIVALDVPDIMVAADLVEELAPHVGLFKVGLELITSTALGYNSIIDLPVPDQSILLDLKLHDIPNTMAAAVRRAAASPKLWGVTIHASAGLAGLQAAFVEKKHLNLCAVTVLTSHSEESCGAVYGDSVEHAVLRFARLAWGTRMDAIICSPKELTLIKNALGDDVPPLRITPGVRPLWADNNDQARVMRPAEAIRAGATHLVIGRPITNPPDGMSPAQAADRILTELA